MATRTKVVGGNWKCNAGNGCSCLRNLGTHEAFAGTTQADVAALVDGLNALPTPGCQVYLCPPSIYLNSVQQTAASHFNVSVCTSVTPTATVDHSRSPRQAQNVWKLEKGAYTGEVPTEGKKSAD